eukprot:3582050-Lingulodinium_polyedra.AAC.1
MAFDAWQGPVVRGQEVARWCVALGLQQSQKFNDMLGEGVSKVLALAWAHRTQFLYDAWKDDLFKSPDTKTATMASYPGEPVIIVLAEGATGLARAEVQRIRSIIVP